MSEPIAIRAAFSKAATTVDGGWNLTFACSQDEVRQVALLSELREQLLYVVVMTAEEYERAKRRG